MGSLSTRALLLLAALGWSLASATQAQASGGLCAESALPAASEPEHAVPMAFAPFDPFEPLDERDLPWCTSADDPRCAPLPAHAPASDDASRGCAGVLAPVSATRPHVHPHAVRHTACVGLCEAVGTRLRLERPPRM
jgi:hypothetical protein